MTPRIVGWSGIYQGRGHAALYGKRVNVVAVRKQLPPPEEPLRITSNDELAALGGIGKDDRVDVAPALADGTFGDVVADVAVQDIDNASWIFNPPPPDSHIG